MGKLEERNLTFQIDTGASISCISEKILANLKQKPQTCSAFRTQIASGQSFSISQYIEAAFELDRYPNIIFKAKLYVIPGDVHNVLLGEPFLIEQEALIDYRQARLRLAG